MDTTQTLTPFSTTATDPLNIGADALLFVMAYGHTISVPTAALEFARRVAVLSIARRDTPEPVLRDVNRAIDVIAASVRARLAMDNDDATLRALVAEFANKQKPEPPKNDGMRVQSKRPVPILPPAGAFKRF